MKLADVQPKTLVDAGLFEDEKSALYAAMQALLEERPDVRIGLAIHRYREGGISIAKAAGLGGTSIERMKQLLDEAGVELRLGPATIAEALSEAEVVERQFREHTT